MSKKLSISSLDEFVYGKTPAPVRCGRNVVIGGGEVLPEVNFTLPPMDVNDKTWPKVVANYDEMITGVLHRAAELEVPQLLIEFETLPEMTNNPKWGLELSRLLADKMDEFYEKKGLRSALRLTPNDVREFSRPPVMRRGKYWDAMKEFFAGAGEAGADMVSIESTGGKELCDEALLNGDLRGVVFALGVLGARDMKFLWEHIVAECRRQNIVPAGDSACGFANTAMVLADRHMIPAVFAAVVRTASVPRALAAMTAGAVGPSKDCAYEGPFLKALTGIPISMEGKSAACAHLSPVGNIAQAVCDCWSNESVQNVQLLSGKAQVVSVEQLAYDCRLMNTAAATQQGALQLRDWLADSDSALNVQAYVLRPDVVLRVSERIAESDEPYTQTLLAVDETLKVLREGLDEGRVRIAEREQSWLDIMEMALEDLPDTEEGLIEEMLKDPSAEKFLPEEYGIA